MTTGLKTSLVVSLMSACGLGLVLSATAQNAKKPPVSDSKVDWTLFLPAGEGQFQTSVYCTTCHTLEPIVAARRENEAGWTAVVQTMSATNNANIQEDDGAAIEKYLAKFFTPTTPKLTLPINVNEASKETLRLIGTLSDSDVQKIIDARQTKRFATLTELEAVVGAEKLSKYKTYLTF